MLFSCSSLQSTNKIERFKFHDFEDDIGISSVVRTGDTLYLSGMVAEGKDMEEQLQAVYTSILKLLEKFDLNSKNIVKETIFTVGMDDLIALKKIRKNYFDNDNYPSATWVQVERLFDERFVVEVDVIVKVSQ